MGVARWMQPTGLRGTERFANHSFQLHHTLRKVQKTLLPIENFGILNIRNQIGIPGCLYIITHLDP